MSKQPRGVITEVLPGKVGQRAGLKRGDVLLAINEHSLRDVIDVQFYAAEETLDLLIERDGREQLFKIERNPGEEMGLTFANPTFDVGIRRCSNNCDFCFVKQNAPGMRQSLYIKDDDYRYSFLFGNFVTLTNLTGEDWARLEEQRISPLYVSVHATDLDLRRRFLSRKTAPDVLDQLRRLADLGIDVHTQVVLVPGLNDGEHLAQTVADLTALHSCPVESVGIVPLGLTRYHRGRCRTYTPVESRAVLNQVEEWRVENRAERDCAFLYPSDEWYLVAGWEVPRAEEYDGFPQAENGIGMVRQLLDEWNQLAVGLERFELTSATLVCGTLIAPLMSRIVGELKELTGAGLRLVPVTNRFFGSVTTVSGLLTGADVVAALHDQNLGEWVLLPRAMFTGVYGAGSAPPGMTLDGMSIADVSAQVGVPVVMAGTMTEVLVELAPGSRTRSACPPGNSLCGSVFGNPARPSAVSRPGPNCQGGSNGV
jgi:putative radical SAM enzyme (TIGR03279 family)